MEPKKLTFQIELPAFHLIRATSGGFMLANPDVVVKKAITKAIIQGILSKQFLKSHLS